jgi:hypothetical protein
MRLWCHPCRVIKSFAVSSTCIHTSVKRFRSSVRWNDPWTEQTNASVDNLHYSNILLLKFLSFLHSQSDQITVIAPTLIKVLYLWSTPFSQLPKILATLRGRYKVEPIWMIDHIDLANRHWKNKCLIVSSWWKNIHVLLPCQLPLARLSLVRMTPDDDTMQRP